MSSGMKRTLRSDLRNLTAALSRDERAHLAAAAVALGLLLFTLIGGWSGVLG